SGCDAVMGGRALAARPWLLWQVGERLGFAAPLGREGEPAPSTPLEEGAEFGRACLTHLRWLQEYLPFEMGSARFRFYLRMTIGWLEFGHHLFASCSAAKDYATLSATVEKFFSSPQKMSPRTALRE